MIGDLSQYASVEFTPESSATLLSVANPLGVVPKFVRIKTPFRATEEGPKNLGYEAFATPLQGGGLSLVTGSDYTAVYTPTEDIPTQIRTYRMTSSTIEFERASVNGHWYKGITYTVHIYA